MNLGGPSGIGTGREGRGARGDQERDPLDLVAKSAAAVEAGAPGAGGGAGTLARGPIDLTRGTAFDGLALTATAYAILGSEAMG